jgi:hypothetical protein
VPIATNSTVFYKSAQLVGDAGDINILGRSRAVAEEVHSAVETQAKETGLSINVDKTKIMIQTRKTIAGQVIHINNQDIEIVDSFVYLGSSLNTRNDETTEIRRRILMANIAYFSVLYLIKSRTIHRKNKISIYRTIIRPILCYVFEAWMMTSKSDEMLHAFERKNLRRVYGPKKVEGGWRMRYNTEINDLYKEVKVLVFIKLRRLQ